MPQRANAIHFGMRETGRSLRRSFRGYPFLMVSLAAINFGMTLMMPGYRFGPGFRAMGQFATEQAWGSVFLAAGVVHLIALVIWPRQAWLPAIPIMAAFAMVSTSSWISVGLLSTGAGTYALIAALGYWSIAERS